MTALLTLAAGVLLFVAQATAPATDTSTTREAEPMTLLRRVPQTTAEITPRVALAAERMAALAPETQPATAPADPNVATALAAVQARYRAWDNYLNRLRRAAKLLATLPELRSEAHIETVTAEIEEIKREAATIRRAPVPVDPTDEDIATLESQVEALQTRVDILADDQAQRTSLLTTGYEEQRQKTEAELKQLRQEYEALLTRRSAEGTPTTAPAEPGGRPAERLLFEVRIATGELTLEAIEWERQQTELLASEGERRLKALRDKLGALQGQLSAMVQSKGRDRIERLEQQQAATADPFERALIDLQLLSERTLMAYFRSGDRATTAGREADKLAAERLSENVSLSQSFWDRAGTSLEFRSGEEAFELQRQLNEEIDMFTSRSDRLRTRHAAALSRLRELQRVRDRVLRRFGELADRARTEAQSSGVADRGQVDAQISQLRGELADAMRTRIETIEQRVERSTSALAAATEHLGRLRAIKRTLRWQRIARRDAGLLMTDWTEAGTEMALVGQALVGAPPPRGAASLYELEAELFGDRADTYTQVRAVVVHLRAYLQSVTSWGWVRAGLVVAGAVVVGLIVWRVSRRTSIPLARRIEAEYAEAMREGTGFAAGLSGRINLLGWNLLGDLAVPLLVAVVLSVQIEVKAGLAVARPMLLVGIWMIAGAIALWRLVHHLFEADSPPHRPLPCADGVAHHYRWWLITLIVVSLVVLLVPLLLVAVEAALAVQVAGLELFKTLCLIILLLFLFRKQQVLGLLGMIAGQWTQMLVSVLYPIVFLLILVLLLLQVVGYGALVSFVGYGAALSAAALLFAAAVSEYIVDLVERYWHWKTRPLTPAEVPAPEREEESEEVAESRQHYVLFMTKALVRLLAALATLVAVLGVWNLPLPHEWVDGKVLGLGALVIIIALIVDRVIFAALFTLQRAGRLPESTTNLIRRWIRGALTVLVVLTLVALTGTAIDSVWTFLTTLLAMVAIGFVAVWSILSNVLATLVILIWRPFNVGEEIEISPDGLTGRVVDISFIYTVLKSPDGTRTSVPNNLFAQKYICRKPGRAVPTRTLAEQLEEEKAIDE